MKILVTGGAGFIGSHIVDRLLEKRFEVIVIDNLSTGNKKNINPKSTVYNADITDLRSLEKVFEKEKPDYVVHAAANIKVRESVKNPIHDANVNIIGGLNIFECCKNFHIKKIIYLSSGGAIYGDPKYLPVDEEHTIDPISPYGISKRALELYLNSCHEAHNLNFVGLRLSNVYGPRDSEESDHIIPVLIHNILNDKTPIISGDGSQARDFIYVDDVADAVLMGLEKNPKEKFFNIGTEKATSINELFNEIKSLLKSSISAKYKEENKSEVKKICLSIRKAKKELGWVPKTSLSQGMKETIKWFKEK